MTGRRRTGGGNLSSPVREHQQAIRTLDCMPLSCLDQSGVFKSICNYTCTDLRCIFASLRLQPPACVSVRTVQSPTHHDRISVAKVHFADVLACMQH